MNLPIMALILVFLLAMWLFVRRRQAARTKDAQPATRSSSSNKAFHAVSISFPSNACNAAKEMDGRRFLSTAAPKLPLADCDVLECSCRFVHHEDRRTSKDRRSPFAPSGYGTATGSFKQEQRKGKDRRAETDEDLF